MISGIAILARMTDKQLVIIERITQPLMSLC